MEDNSDSTIFVSQDQIHQLVDGLSKVICDEIKNAIHHELPLAVKAEMTKKEMHMQDLVPFVGRAAVHAPPPRDRTSVNSMPSNGGRVDHVPSEPSKPVSRLLDNGGLENGATKGGRHLAKGYRAVKCLKEFDDYNVARRGSMQQRVSLLHAETTTTLFEASVGDEGARSPSDGLRTQKTIDGVEETERGTSRKTSMSARNAPRELRAVSLPARSTMGPEVWGERKSKSRRSLLDQTQIFCIYITKRRWFGVSAILLIATNAISIGANTDWSARNLDKDSDVAFDVLEMFFCIAFALELLVRIGAYRTSFFIPENGFQEDSEWRWNWFDAFLVLAQLFELSIALAVDDDQSIGINMSFMRVLRVLRVVRVIRLVRIVHLISELRTIVASILGSLKSLGFTIVIIVFLIYMMGLFITQVVTDTLRDNTDAVALFELQEYWKSVPQSCLTLFQSMTNGVDWGSAAKPLIDHVSPLMAVFFSIFIAFANFAMLNVITGVFVESAITMDSAEKDTTMVARLYEFLCNQNGDGVLTWEDFESSLDDPAIQLYFKTVDLDVAEARNLFLLLDADGNGSVETAEFVTGCLRLKGDAKAIDLATFMYDTRRWQTGINKSMQEFKAALSMLVQYSFMDSPRSPTTVDTSRVSNTARFGSQSGENSRIMSDFGFARRSMEASDEISKVESSKVSAIAVPPSLPHPSMCNHYPSSEHVEDTVR